MDAPVFSADDGRSSEQPKREEPGRADGGNGKVHVGKE